MALIELEEEVGTQARIKVVGVGGGGGNAINTMIASGLDGVDFIAANTDLQALDSNLAPMKVQLGSELTRGLGAGADPERGRLSAEEDPDRVLEALDGADMVFVTAGMGGGTGTGAAPVIARIAKEMGALTVGVVTKPFAFEGRKRMRYADHGIGELRDSVDTLITIPNERLLSVAGQATTMLDAFRRVDEVLHNAVQGISDLVIIHGFINVDFADVRTVMSDMGHALMGTGYGVGDRKALEAAKQAVSSPLLEDTTIDGATGILINITGGPDLTLSEINEAASLIHEAADEDANIIFGSVIDANLEDQVRITVIATGFPRPEKTVAKTKVARRAQPQPQADQQQLGLSNVPTLNELRRPKSAARTPEPIAEPTVAPVTVHAQAAPPQRTSATTTVRRAAAEPAPGSAPAPAPAPAPTYQAIGDRNADTQRYAEPEPHGQPPTTLAYDPRGMEHRWTSGHVDDPRDEAVTQPTIPVRSMTPAQNAVAAQNHAPAPAQTPAAPALSPAHSAETPIEAARARRTTTSSNRAVPRLHPNLDLDDEQDMDVPTFLRRSPAPVE